ncbi:type VII secretion-associated serine protease mycosin [Krasilnikovia cinnamomea]|uniref:Type VII secretion-associated serine protease mycosin n=1 Tax=Krasilnikovia cinnamomea TaxID=349313 RepID=A0A4Q7ZSY9_9ACTN|nr:type VII secretion-associated serine protease mycosin [Krasilnikovia cinnamomea]RZU54317.1 type VII secretion-associated serine protease mycosin [Krasilnikovia cinnamomea]
MRKTVAAVAVAFGVLLPVPAQARAAACGQQPASGPVSRAVPYEAQLYGLDRLGRVADGSGVRVAVLDSGVDAQHPQLQGRVDTGLDMLRGNRDARQDCVGHGTGVASIIAGRRVDGVPFHGLAPRATIVPVRISEQETIDGRTVGDFVSPEKFAQAIDWASDPRRGNAQVINLSVVMIKEEPAVHEAVDRALRRGVVVVAAVGNAGGAQGANPTPYPAAYDGVIGVGSIGPDGLRAEDSQHGRYVTVMAAGVGVTMAAPRSGHAAGNGTSFAAPFVAATAALLKQRFPDLSPGEITRRILATADPAPGGGRSDEYGYGLLNPYRALTETLAPDGAAPPAPVVVHRDDAAQVAREARRQHAQDRALLVAAAGAAAVVLLGGGAAVVRRGRRRGWRPASG